MENQFGSCLSGHHYQHQEKTHKRSFSERSLPMLKRPKLFSSVRGFMHRKARSVGSVRTTTSINELMEPSFSPLSSRARSLDRAKQPARFKQRRGETPGMDDYLTLAELENVWQTQDVYLGCYDAPQRARGYTYTDPVEAPTITKHQTRCENRSTLNLTRHQPLESRNPPTTSMQQSPQDAEKAPRKGWHRFPLETRSAPTTATGYFRPEDIRAPSPTRASRPVPKTSFSRPLHYDRGFSDDSIRPPSPLRPRKAIAPLKPSSHAKESYPGTADNATLNVPRPVTAPSRETANSPSIYSQPSPRSSPSPSTDVRNAVVSGIVHPALRPSPYFIPHQAPASCRVASQFAVGIPPSNHAYGRV